MTTTQRYAPGLALALSLALGQAPVHALPADRAAEVEVGAVVDAFQAAIRRKDGAALRALFLPDPVTWISVDTDAHYAQRLAAQPQAPKFRRSTVAQFADYIATAPEPVEEQFRNLRIHSDGSIASVHFDFVFLVDGRRENQGQEAWQLVKTAQGWRICALIYSSG